MTLDEIRPYVGEHVTVSYRGDRQSIEHGTRPEDVGALDCEQTGRLQIDGVVFVGGKAIHHTRITSIELAPLH